MNKQWQRGVALVGVLVVMATVTAISTALYRQQMAAIRSADHHLQWRQAWYLALTAETVAAELLRQDWDNEDSREADSYAEQWARGDLAIALPEGRLRFRVFDAQSRININNLRPGASPRDDPLQRLIPQLLIRTGLPRAFYVDLLDWLDGNDLSRLRGRESRQYQSLGYLPANRPLADVSELLLLRSAVYQPMQALLPHVAALPPETPWNLNTFAPDLLALAIPGGERFAGAIERRQQQGGYASVALWLESEAAPFAALESQFSVSSDWFELVAQLEYREVKLEVRSLLWRNPANGKIRVHWRQRYPWSAQLPEPYAKL